MDLLCQSHTGCYLIPFHFLSLVHFFSIKLLVYAEIEPMWVFCMYPPEASKSTPSSDSKSHLFLPFMIVRVKSVNKEIDLWIAGTHSYRKDEIIIKSDRISGPRLYQGHSIHKQEHRWARKCEYLRIMAVIRRRAPLRQTWNTGAGAPEMKE